MAREDQEREAGRTAAAALEQDIKNRAYRRVYLMYGEETYLRDSYRRRLASCVSGDDTMNVRVFDGKAAEAERIVSAAESLPFFADYVLVIVRDSGLFKKSPDELVDFIGHIPETTVMIFDEESVDKRSRLYKKLAAAGLVVPCPKQSEQSLRQWVAAGFGKMGKKITRDALDYFLDSVGDSMVYIRQEMDKLASYTGDRQAIVEADVAAITSVRAQNRIFDMIDSVASGERERAMRTYSDLLELRQPPMIIIYMLARHFMLLNHVKEMSESGMAVSQIAASCKTQEWAVKRKYLPQSRRFTKEQLEENLKMVAETEQSVKRGNLSDRVAVEPLILSLIGEK